MNIIDRISKKDLDKEQLAKEVMNSPESILQLIEGLSDSRGSVRFGCEKILRIISEHQPILIYPHFDTFEPALF